AVVAIGLGLAAPIAAWSEDLSLTVDATQVPQKMLQAKLVIPVKPGPVTLYYPKWIPGEHGPDGPVGNLTGLKFEADGKTIPWQRDLLDVYTFHVNVPAGVTHLNASYDYIEPDGSSATDKLLVLEWNEVVLYPAGAPSKDIIYDAKLTLPDRWQFGTSLPIAGHSANEATFRPISLDLLVDSPVLAGEYYRSIDLTPPGEPIHHEIDLAADSEAALNMSPQLKKQLTRLVAESGKLFGARHYRDYHFLLALSDHVAHFGLEHHESNDSRLPERALADVRPRVLSAGLLPHEYVHSWNGKYRRPADLTTSNYDQPMQTDLLWVYEGLTSYLGEILTARSGLWTPQQFMDSIASIAAELDHRPGRTWRNLQDTADGAQILYGSPRHWESWRRRVDFYDEDVLNWLWVDVIIRQQTQGRRSIDDFCKAFHGAPSGPPMVKTYTFDDIVNTLNQIAPYDWRSFWLERLKTHAAHAPLGGIEASGWRVVYDDQPSELLKDREEESKGMNVEYSIGLELHEKGEIVDVIHDSPAARAGIGPGMILVAINGKKFKREVLRDALRESKNSKQPIELLVENTDYYKTYSIDYHGGTQYPHLVRDTSKPDLLNEIIKPVTVAGQ